MVHIGKNNRKVPFLKFCIKTIKFYYFVAFSQASQIKFPQIVEDPFNVVCFYLVYCKRG